MTLLDDGSRIPKKPYSQLRSEYAAWQSHMRVLPNWSLGTILVISLVVRYVTDLPSTAGTALSIVAVFSLIALARRDGHREGWLEGYDGGYDDGRFAYLGIDEDGQQFLDQIEMDASLERLKKGRHSK